MNSIAQEAAFRFSVFSYAEKNGATKAANKYHVSRQFIYRLRWRYDGTKESLLPRSRRPHGHPNQHNPNEIKSILDMHRRNPHYGLTKMWIKLRRRGYERSITGLYRCLIRLGLKRVPPANPKYIPKPYQAAKFPGEKVQVDVKVVPTVCIVGDAQRLGEKMYQYTAIDEYSRYRFIYGFKEQSTYSSTQFLKMLVKKFPFRICKVQTDNGFEFTNRFGKSDGEKLTLFEKKLKELGIEHQKIRPYTPRHNGKVERSHRKDNEEFYALHKFFSFDDFQKQLSTRNREYNNFPMRPLKWKTPQEVLRLRLTSVTDD